MKFPALATGGPAPLDHSLIAAETFRGFESPSSNVSPLATLSARSLSRQTVRGLEAPRSALTHPSAVRAATEQYRSVKLEDECACFSLARAGRVLWLLVLNVFSNRARRIGTVVLDVWHRS
jgi:hypothetical protein